MEWLQELNIVEWPSRNDHSRITTNNFWRTLRSSKICRLFRTFWTQPQHWDSHHQSTNQYHLSGFNSGIIVPRRMDKPLTILETTNQNSFNTSNSIALVCSNMFKLQTSSKNLWTSYVLRCLTTSEFGGVWCSKQSSEWSSGFEELHFGGIRGTATFLHSLSRTAEGMAAWPTSFLEVTNSAWTILDKCWSCRTVVGHLPIQLWEDALLKQVTYLFIQLSAQTPVRACNSGSSNEICIVFPMPLG